MSKNILFSASGKALVILLVTIAVVFAAIALTMANTSSTEFCMSCHEMKVYKQELEKSSHAVDKDKQEIACKDCHIPNTVSGKYVIVKTMLGVGDFMAHHFGDPDNLDRRKLQKIARRFVLDDNCLACHQDLFKDAKGGDSLSEIGRLCHEAYLGKNGQTRRGCAGCHFNMAHLPEFDRRYHFNAEFAKKLPLNKESQNAGS
ncbi:MAG: NapC/NirT family cytochrome c [Desulfobacter sp.]